MLEHVAIWTNQLETMKDFYCSYFHGSTDEKYESDSEFDGHFASYFVSFGDGCRLELMSLTGIPDSGFTPGHQAIGLTHLAFSVASKTEVDALAKRAQQEAYSVLLQPHMTGDNYYEACILDPDGNRVEITVLP